MKLFKAWMAAAVFGVVAFVILLALAFWLLRFAAPIPSNSAALPSVPSLLSVTDTISGWFGLLGIMVALSALITTVVAIAVGAMAFWGYRTLGEQLGKQAKLQARGAALQYIEGEEMKRYLTSESQRILEVEFKKWREAQDLAASQPPQTALAASEGADSSSKVGRPIRRKR